MEINIVNFSKGPLMYDAKECAESQMKEWVLEIKPRVTYSDDWDYVGFQLDIQLSVKEKILYKSGFLIGMIVKGWKEIVKKSEMLVEEKEVLGEIYRLAWTVATGVVMEQTTDKSSAGVILPPYSEDMVGDIMLIPRNKID